MDRIGANDALRLGLEVAALASFAYWGWAVNSGGWRFVLGIGLPLIAAVLWGTFRVPGDPGHAPVAVPGSVRLGLEGALFGAAVAGLADAGRPALAIVLGGLIVAHYAVARERLRRLLGRREP